MTEEYNNTSHEIKSKYNAAIAQLYRLDDLWKDAHKHARNNELQKWNLDLDAVWRELAEIEKPGGDVEDAYSTINTELINNGINMIPYTLGFKQPSNAFRIMLGKLYYLLNKKEIFLRRLQHDQGKGTVWAESDDEYGD